MFLRLSVLALLAALSIAPVAAQDVPAKPAKEDKSITDTMADLHLTWGAGGGSRIFFNEETGEPETAKFWDNVRADMEQGLLECHDLEIRAATGTRGRQLIATATPTTPVVISEQQYMAVCGEMVRDFETEVITLSTTVGVRPVVYYLTEKSLYKYYGASMTLRPSASGKTYRPEVDGLGGFQPVDLEKEMPDLTPYLRLRLERHLIAARRYMEEKAKEKAKLKAEEDARKKEEEKAAKAKPMQVPAAIKPPPAGQAPPKPAPRQVEIAE